MSLRWEDERYVRLYTRDTPDWDNVSGPANGLFCLLMRKVDRAGLLPIGRRGLRGIAEWLKWPWDQAESLFQELFDDGRIRLLDGALLIPNFIAAQEVRTSDVQRKREQRERERAYAMSQPVTRRHTASQHVTPNLSEPNLTKPSIKPADSASRNGAHPIPDGLPIQQSEPKPAKQQTGKKPPKQPSGTNEAIAFYCEQWVAVRCPIDGKAPKLGAADIKAAVSLVRDYGLDSAKAFIERFIADADKFLVERGHMLRDIGQRVNGYRATAGPQRRFKNVEVACEPYAEGEGGVQDL